MKMNSDYLERKDYYMDYAKRRYLTRTEKNLCMKCGIDLGNSPFLRCKECRDILNENAKRTKEKRKSQLVCKKCGHKKAKLDNTMCTSCIKKYSGNSGIFVVENGETVIDEVKYICHGCGEYLSSKTIENTILVDVPNRKYLVKKYLCNDCYKHCEDTDCNDCHFDGKRGFIYECNKQY
jgi:hypothetical protein